MLNFVKLFISNLLILCCLASASKNEEAKVGDCKITQKAFNHQKLDINSSSLPINGESILFFIDFNNFFICALPESF